MYMGVKYASPHKIDHRTTKVVSVGFEAQGFWSAYLANSFGDRGWDHDKYDYIEHDGFHVFVGNRDVFDDFSLIIAFLCELIDLIRH